MKTSLRQVFVLLSPTSILVSVMAGAQTPWTVTVAPAMDPIPAGVCSAVKLSFTDAAGAVPRNPDGSRILQSDFDLVVTASNPASVAGMYSGSNNWAACVCQGAPAGSVATITATYPSQGLAESMRVGRVTAKASATFVTSKPQGPVNPPGCQSAALRAIAETRPLSVPVSSITKLEIAKVPVVVAPSPLQNSTGGSPTTSGVSSPVPISVADTKVPLPAPSPTVSGVNSPTVTATGVKIPLAPAAPPPAPSVIDPTNPSGFTAVQTGPGRVLLTWDPVPYASYYVLFGPGLQQGGARIGTGGPSAVATGGVSIGTTATGVPAGNQQWAVGSYYYPDGVSTAAADFPRVTLNVMLTVPINPSGIGALQIATGVVRLSWQPVNGVSYYRLYGAGLPDGGVKVEPPGTVSNSTVTSQSITYTATAVVAGLRLWRVGSFLDPGAVSTDSATFPRVTLNVAEQVPGNPSGFTAVQTRPGVVRLSWQLMYGATYYMLSGDGLPSGGVKVLPPSYLSLPNSPVTSDSVTWAVSDLPAGLHSWQVGSFRDPGAISADPATFPTVTLNVKAVVNPSGFSAAETAPGIVRLSWQPVTESSYYMLYGPGVPNGRIRIELGGGMAASTGASTGVVVPVLVGYTVTPPAGLREWQVGSFFDPGGISTDPFEFPKATLTVTKPVPINPSGFTGTPLGPGEVRFSWQPVTGASYYKLFGPGLPGMPNLIAKVGLGGSGSSSTGTSGSVGYTWTGLPPGPAIWKVASYFEPGEVSTFWEDFPQITVIVEPPSNPCGFTAVQTSIGVVRLSWQPVSSASGYVLFGPGLGPTGGVGVAPGASGVSGTTGTLARVGFTATGVPSGLQLWQVGSFFGDLRTDPAVFPKVTLNVTPPINPSGFTAVQTSPGVVRLSWQPVKEASYYVLLGPGLPQGGVKVGLGTTGAASAAGTFEWVEFTAIGVPSGSQEWAVASYYEPGPISTPAAEFPRVSLNVTPPINPSGFAARQTGSGQVRFSWQPVSGASYYIVTGTGLPKSGIKVGPGTSGASGPTGTFEWVEVTASGIPPGPGTWQVGSYFDPGSISTPVSAFPTVTLTVNLQTP